MENFLLILVPEKEKQEIRFAKDQQHIQQLYAENACCKYIYSKVKVKLSTEG